MRYPSSIVSGFASTVLNFRYNFLLFFGPRAASTRSPRGCSVVGRNARRGEKATYWIFHAFVWGGFIAAAAQRKSRGERIISRLIPTLPISPPFSPTAPAICRRVNSFSLFSLFWDDKLPVSPPPPLPESPAFYRRPFPEGQKAGADERERESERALAVKFPGGVIPCQDRRGRDINSPISPLGNTMGAKNKQSSISPLFSSLIEASVLTHYNCN